MVSELGAGSRTRTIEAQRARIIEAMAEVVAERGFACTSVVLVTARAKVSTRTFYECFDGLEDCFRAILRLGFERSGAVILEAFVGEDGWRDGVLAALASLLLFYDSEPQLTRVWFVEVMATGSWALELRERNVGLIRAMIVEHLSIPGYEPPEPVLVAGVMASVLGLINTHLVTREPEPLITLLGSLMALVTTPYLDAQTVALEVERGEELARAIQAGDPRWQPPRATESDRATPEVVHGATLPSVLANPSARRARECLLFVAAHPDSSNREIAAGIGVTHQSQISRLLSYLVKEDLVAKRSEGAGKRNTWRLTPHGEEIARRL